MPPVHKHARERRSLREEGAAAFENGVPLFDCPYPYKSNSNLYWRRGWNQARKNAVKH